MNWAVLYLILCTVRIYATFELFPPRMFENIHQSSEAMYTINYVCEKILILYSTYLIVQ